MPDTKVTKKSASSKSEEKKTAGARKTAAEAEKKPRARKTAPKKPEINLDTMTTLIWNRLENKDVSQVQGPIAIQVNVHNIGIFYIAVKAKEDEDKQVIQSDYYLPDGNVDTTAEEIQKIAAGNYDYIAAVKNGALSYHGNLAKAIALAELLNS